jgi:hypothetical protein
MAGLAIGYRNNSSTSSRVIQGTISSVLTTSLSLLIYCNSNLMSFWLCVIIDQYSGTNEMHFLYSVYYELKAYACFEHYLLIFRRCCTNNNWYIVCVLCLLAATRFEVEAEMRATYVQPVSQCIKFHENVDKTVKLITSTIHHPYSYYTRKLTLNPPTQNVSFDGRDTVIPLLN